MIYRNTKWITRNVAKPTLINQNYIVTPNQGDMIPDKKML